MFRQTTQAFIPDTLKKRKTYSSKENIKIQAGGVFGAALGFCSPIDYDKTIPGKIAQKMEQVTIGAVAGIAMGIGAGPYLRTASISIPLSYIFLKHMII